MKRIKKDYTKAWFGAGILATAGCIVHSLVVPDFWLWVWFKNPVFNWPKILLWLVVFLFLSFVVGVFRKADYDKEVILDENKRRRNLNASDYKTDLWQGSFDKYPTITDADGNPTASVIYPKPPDAVPPLKKRLRDNL